MPDMRCFERPPPDAREMKRLTLRGDGRLAFETVKDPWGQDVQIVRLTLLPVIPPRSERDARRILIEAHVSEKGTKWIELVDDSL